VFSLDVAKTFLSLVGSSDLNLWKENKTNLKNHPATTFKSLEGERRRRRRRFD
jgi:hypothetical protein